MAAKKVPVTEKMVRVVVTSRDARQDYWLPLSTAQALDLPTVAVYANKRTYYDPTARHRPART